MKTFKTIIFVAALCAFLPLSMAQAAPFKMRTVKSEAQLGKWGASWWLWALSAPEGNNPISDLSGRDCAVNQSGLVWFLAGTYENGKPIKRSCTIPAGKLVLFPLINTYGMGDSQAECNASLQDSSAVFNKARIEYLKIDGQTVNTSRTRGRLACTYMPKYRKWLGVDGYWGIAELAKGKHSLSFKASVPEFIQNVTYSLVQR